MIIGVVAARKNSELLLELVSATGLRFDPTLSKAEAYSHMTRVRALLPKIIAGYDELAESEAVSAANGLAAALEKEPDVLDAVCSALRPIGWDIRDRHLAASDEAIREIFFPKGSQWDAFVVLRSVFDEAKSDLMVVDSYCDRTLFQYLSTRSAQPLSVDILCGQYAMAVAAEAKVFVAQHSGWNINVRQAKDFHDRFVVVDGTSCVHIGASINGAGKTAFMISRVEDQQNRSALLSAVRGSWTAATVVT
ncbi:hypothetical protein ADM96_04150 [Burkholderia sp. ST111]|nr:hypothetical protein ADM96_04150 [Burkholderia sp. ST111]